MTLLELIHFTNNKKLIYAKTFDKWKCQPYLTRTINLFARKNYQHFFFKVLSHKKRLILDILFHEKAATIIFIIFNTF